MKQLLLGGAMLLAIAAPGSPARAVPIDFTYTGNLVTFTVPTTDTYQILAFGAQGGDFSQGGVTALGGRGAEIGGDFTLTAGEVLQIAVGGAGHDEGGGGGSFVVGPGNTPLVIAGGGGGAGYAFTTLPPITLVGLPGGNGLTGPDGGGGDSGGTAGQGGFGGDRFNLFNHSGGGGGFLSAGTSYPACGDLCGGGWPDLTAGTPGGGFGGGSGSPGESGGGGGGYSGGGGGFFHAQTASPGGGGGSWDAGTDQILLAGFRTGNGEVIITEIAAAVPEPSTLALLGAGLVCLAAIWRRRRPEA